MIKSKLSNYQEERPWGYFKKFCENKKATVKLIVVKPGQSLSLQKHNKRAEFWRVLKGSGVAQVNNNKMNIKEGDEIIIPLKAKHRLMSKKNKLEILEISFGQFDEKDIIRFDDKYNRLEK